ncbi:MAG: phage holin family protein [Bacteroidetes bacterium]|nr:phage holin family protein [Bacteroidota bacterium]
MLESLKIEELTESFKKYVASSYDLFKLESAERAAEIGSSLISRFLVLIAAFSFIFFISLWAGFYLSSLYGNNYSGFAIIGGFYFLLCIILLFTRKKLVETPIRDQIIRKVFNKITIDRKTI